MKFKPPQAAIAIFWALAACAPARSETVLPDGTYAYEMPGKAATAFSGRITVSRASGAIVVREDAMLQGSTIGTTRTLDPTTFSVLAFRDGSGKEVKSAPGKPAIYLDFLPASLFMLPALFHATHASSIDAYSTGLMGGDTTAQPFSVTTTTQSRPAGVPAGDLSLTMNDNGRGGPTIWYDPSTFVTTAVAQDGNVMFRLLEPSDSQPAAVVPIGWDYAPISLDVRAGAQKWHLLLDARSDLVLSGKVAAAAGLAEPVRVPEIDLSGVGEVALRNVPAATSDGAGGWDGAIGYPIFSAYRAVIDIENRAMALYPFDHKPLKGTVVLPIELLADHTPVVHATIGGVPATLAIAMSTADNVTLSEAFARKHGFFSAHAPVASNYRDAKGIDVRDAGTKQLRLGTLSQNVPAYVEIEPPIPFADGFIGMGFLSAYRIEFDYSQHEMALQAR